LNFKIALYLPPPPCLYVCSSSGKEVIKVKVGTGNTFPWERYLKFSILAPSIFLELMIHTQ
jgi:hypothetical protein